MMDYDILIVGGGMVGASLARALTGSPLRIGVIEAVPFDAPDQPSFDVRAIALAQGSRRIFSAIGVWERMRELGVSAITRIHVSDRGHFGSARLSAAEEGVEALGYVAEAGVLGRALGEGLAELPNVELLCPARVLEVATDQAQARVLVDQAGSRRELRARLLVAADGGRSTVRDLTGARIVRLGYGQTAVIANVVTDRPHGGVAYERFTDTGPLALLPSTAPRGSAEEVHGDRRWSLVWTVRSEQTPEVLALDDGPFLAALQARFGQRAGRFVATGSRSAYPLGLQYVRDHVRPRLAFIGNAAHTIHPVGGQGFNLGLRDVAVLAEVIAGADDPGSAAVLRAYGDWRRGDYLRVLAFTDGLARLFSNNLPPLVLARSAGMVALDLLPPARHLFARQAMGLTGRQTRLGSGIALFK